MLTTYLYSYLGLLLFLIIAFTVGTVKKNNGLMDVFYGLGYIVLAILGLTLEGTFHIRQIIVTILVIIWGLRLSIYVFNRNKGKPEDFRYRDMRKRWGKQVLIKSFIRIYMFQGLVIIVVALPYMFVNTSINSSIKWNDVLGIIIWSIGFLFETLGDYQLFKFKKNPDNKGRVMDKGVWKYSQHPNYFGEVTQWWGIYIVCISIPWGAFFIFSPIFITYMIIKVSGIKLLEKRYEGDGKYANYKKRTRVFIPWFPKKL